MTPPDPPLPLSAAARGFWDRHYARLTAAGLMTDADVDSFAVLCVAFGTVAALSTSATGADYFRENVQLDRAQKTYKLLASEFGLTPRGRKRDKLTPDAPPTKDEFGL